LAHHKVCAVAGKIFLVALVLGGQQFCRRVCWIDQRAVCVLPIFVWIAEQEFAQGNQVAVFKLITGGFSFALPIDFRLAYSVHETERFYGPKERGRQTRYHLESGIPSFTLY
jgi:hypothetical protein